MYGLTFFGDAATVKKSPLINILASSVHLPIGCLQIVDCTGHLESDRTKDAAFIANLFTPHIIEMEKNAPKCTDLVIFDGASNVQKAGGLIEAKFPHMLVMHGADHVISHFYQDIFKLRQFEMLKTSIDSYTIVQSVRYILRMSKHCEHIFEFIFEDTSLQFCDCS